MPRGRKRKSVFIPRPWIPNSSSEDEHQGRQAWDGPNALFDGGGHNHPQVEVRPPLGKFF